MLAVSIDAVLMLNVNRNYIADFARVHLDTLAIHTLNAHQVSCIPFFVCNDEFLLYYIVIWNDHDN